MGNRAGPLPTLSSKPPPSEPKPVVETKPKKPFVPTQDDVPFEAEGVSNFDVQAIQEVCLAPSRFCGSLIGKGNEYEIVAVSENGLRWATRDPVTGRHNWFPAKFCMPVEEPIAAPRNLKPIPFDRNANIPVAGDTRSPSYYQSSNGALPRAPSQHVLIIAMPSSYASDEHTKAYNYQILETAHVSTAPRYNIRPQNSSRMSLLLLLCISHI